MAIDTHLKFVHDDLKTDDPLATIDGAVRSLIIATAMMPPSMASELPWPIQEENDDRQTLFDEWADHSQSWKRAESESDNVMLRRTVPASQLSAGEKAFTSEAMMSALDKCAAARKEALPKVADIEAEFRRRYDLMLERAKSDGSRSVPRIAARRRRDEQCFEDM